VTDPRRIVLLVGSPKGKGGTSQRLGEYILDRIPDEEAVKEIHHIGKTIRKEAKWAKVLAAVDEADTVILSFPLYWDALPSHTTRALELLEVHRRDKRPGREQQMVAICNNGFPEPWHNEVVLRICRRFADEAGFEWGGGLNVGGGAAVDGRPLEETGGMTKKLRESLDDAAGPIGRGESLTSEVEEGVAEQMYPSWIPGVLGGIGWRHTARKHGKWGSLRARPYERK
jgi:hypothetical protein